VQSACLTLTCTGEPYCYYMKPDISVTKMGPEAIISGMRHIGLNTLVMDCWYFSRGVLESYDDIAVTVACGSDDMPSTGDDLGVRTLLQSVPHVCYRWA
jgi:hypothetical protein